MASETENLQSLQDHFKDQNEVKEVIGQLYSDMFVYEIDIFCFPFFFFWFHKEVWIS
jgi:hypothetical protein